MDPHIESFDLAEVAKAVREAFGDAPPAGYIRGRTALRDAVAARFRCSDALAENVVETMIGRGFFRFLGDPAVPGDEGAAWDIRRAE